MKKLALLAGCLMFGQSLVSAYSLKEVAQDFKSDTARYFFSTLTIGYYDHYHKIGDHDSRDGVKEKNLLLSAPICAYHWIGAETFGTFDGSTVKEWGVRFDTQIHGVRSWLHLEPYVFKNEELDATGFGVIAQIKIK